MKRLHPTGAAVVVAACSLLAGAAMWTTRLTVPTDVQLPGTQPLEVTMLGPVSQCDNCHAGYDPADEPGFAWRGSMMANAARDPLFWAAVAVTEQVFPGAGDFCIRCHSPRGWHEGRSTPTDGSALTAGDADGVECAMCHGIVNPDGSELPGVQNPPFVANNGGSPPEAFTGSGMAVMQSGYEKLGPYASTTSPLPAQQSLFHRESAMCGTCHDVSNPLVGDVAHNNGVETPLPPGLASGSFGGPVSGKVAFNAFPHQYGVVERTYSEHVASDLSTTAVSAYATLPEELQHGAIEKAYDAALAAGNGGDYEDGSTRVFSCQTCHMPPTTGEGCGLFGAPTRGDLPFHDMTGGSTWMPDAIQWLDARGRLVLGGGLDANHRAALDAAKGRARATLEGAARLELFGNELRVVNLTGHKLISGFHEGRRMWLRVVWRDASGAVLREDGEYGPMTVQLNGSPQVVETILDPADPHLRIYQAKPGIDQDWAAELIGAGGVPPSLPVHYDRMTGAVTTTLGQLASMAAGTEVETFHFALNNVLLGDSRIPPYRMDYDTARERNALPVPANQYGNPGPGGVYEHFDRVPLAPPAGAVDASIELLYQSTSWEYVQFLLLSNDGSVSHLASTGQDLYDAWLNTGMSPPVVMSETIWCGRVGTQEDLVLFTEVDGDGERTRCVKDAPGGSQVELTLRSPDRSFAGALGAMLLQVYPTGGAAPTPTIPGLWFDRTDVQVTIVGLPPNGVTVPVTIPAGVGGSTVRVQGVVVAPGAAGNGLFASTDAHDLVLR